MTVRREGDDKTRAHTEMDIRSCSPLPRAQVDHDEALVLVGVNVMEDVEG